MVSSGVVAVAFVALLQVCIANPVPNVRYEEGCCPGQVIEKRFVTQRPVTETYTYQVPVYSKKCFQKSGGVDKQVIPRSYETAPVCETQETVVKVPTTDMEVQNQPLCKRTCTTSSYIIQIPITETTCTNSPLCKKTVRSQDNVLTTVSKKTSCAKQTCTQNTVVEKPIFETVCQDYQQSINKVGTKTVLKPEVQKYCVQEKPYRCMKPVYDYAPAIAPVQVSGATFDCAANSAPVEVSGPTYDFAANSAPVHVSGPSYDFAGSSAALEVSGPTYTSANAGVASYDVSSGSACDYSSVGAAADVSVAGAHSWNVAHVPAHSPAPAYGSAPCTCV